MKHNYLLFLFCFLNSTAFAVTNDWVGEWKVNDKYKYMSFSIKSSNKAGLKFYYDEGIGINGIRIYGVVKLKNNNVGFVDTSVRGNPCRLKLQLLKNNTLALSNCELDSYSESDNKKIFVPRSQKLYYRASFNCAKARTKIELAICESKVIARADKKLGSIYKILGKKLSKKNVKRLRKDQRGWIKNRDWKCKKKSNKALNYCLRRHYGKRLLTLNLLDTYKIWHNGNLNYSFFKNIKQNNSKSYFNVMDNGLGLWLGGKINRQLTDTGSYEINARFVKDSYILFGPYRSSPTEGHDPQAFGNKVFIEFSASSGTWLGLVASRKKYIYIPKSKTVSEAPEKFRFWMKDFDEAEILKVF